MTESINTAVADDEFYDEATNEFPSVNDLVPGAHNMIKDTVLGRLVAIWALENGTRKNDSGGTYEYTDAIVLVLDDGPDGKQVTDLVPAAPWEGKLRFSTAGTQSRLAPRVDGWTKAKKGEDGKVIVPSVPMKFRPMIGRINARPSTKVKNGSPAISIASPEPEDKPTIQKFKADIVEINKRLEAKATAAEDAAAFE